MGPEPAPSRGVWPQWHYTGSSHLPLRGQRRDSTTEPVGAPTSRFTVSREATTEPQVSQGKVATPLGGVNRLSSMMIVLDPNRIRGTGRSQGEPAGRSNYYRGLGYDL
jgi:hypothetical protein